MATFGPYMVLKNNVYRAAEPQDGIIVSKTI
jgi:hypothetical protein